MIVCNTWIIVGDMLVKTHMKYLADFAPVKKKTSWEIYAYSFIGLLLFEDCRQRTSSIMFHTYVHLEHYFFTIKILQW